ncbi:plastocyanin [Kitasatospora sp. SolWspMP-SS2h]|uniref:cupredoxin domain-containing protein n=1 Tax=Kitasatospora sp. SolWspMP-SS2h TaxID=1305729 RepID=UPI000DB944C6|nr:cupredoxin domain-containing protein [Kitasatospora sp. SolWspMP-SS2h]RAJ38432.1 plastocyanin [Kitasatospora sp. SolWspMP-SS2h]
MTRTTGRPSAVLALVAALTAVLAAGCSSSAPAPASTSTGPSATASNGTGAPSGSTGGSSSTGNSGSSRSTAATTVSIKDFKFSPGTLTVAPGATVTVTNQDSTTHTLTSAGQKAFDTGSIAPGATATFTAPDTPGPYPYLCTIHQFMTGTLTVQ